MAKTTVIWEAELTKEQWDKMEDEDIEAVINSLEIAFEMIMKAV